MRVPPNYLMSGEKQVIVETSSIVELAEQIVRNFHPHRIILFGSHAYGTPTADSDVDLLVILPFEGKAVYKAVEIADMVAPRFALDLLVRTPEQVEQRLALTDFFMREIVQKGKVLYDAADPGVGR
jgi:predicted nucleotidyltransferase